MRLLSDWNEKRKKKKCIPDNIVAASTDDSDYLIESHYERD